MVRECIYKMSFVQRIVAPFLLSAAFATTSAAQETAMTVPASPNDVSLTEQGIQPSEGSGDENFDYRDYCQQPLKLTTETASEFFNLIGCDDHGVDNEFWINTPLVPEDFIIPTPEDFVSKDPLALCLYGSLPGETTITDEADGMVGTGDFVMGEDVLRDLERGILYECLNGPPVLTPNV